MAIIHMDNFSLYGGNTALMTEGIYASANRCSLANDPDGISPGKVLFPAITGGNAPRSTWRFVHPGGAKPKVGAAFRIWMPNLPNADGLVAFVQLRDAANTIIMTLEPNADGSIEIYSYNDNASAYLYRKRTELPVFTAKGWYHFEIKYEITGAGLAKVEVRVEGFPVLTEENVPVRAVQPAMFAGGFYDNTVFADFFLKDLVIWDGTGTDNTDFVGTVLIHTLEPIDDVALNWTPTPAGPGYSILDNVPPDAGQYLDAAYPPPEAYVATMSDLPPDITSIKALMTVVRAAKTDGGDASLQTSIISSPDDAPAVFAGADRPITVAQTYWRDVSERDPKTNAPWTPGAVDDINVSIDRTV